MQESSGVLLLGPRVRLEEYDLHGKKSPLHVILDVEHGLARQRQVSLVVFRFNALHGFLVQGMIFFAIEFGPYNAQPVFLLCVPTWRWPVPVMRIS